MRDLSQRDRDGLVQGSSLGLEADVWPTGALGVFSTIWDALMGKSYYYTFGHAQDSVWSILVALRTLYAIVASRLVSWPSPTLSARYTGDHVEPSYQLVTKSARARSYDSVRRYRHRCFNILVVKQFGCQNFAVPLYLSGICFSGFRNI